MSINSIDTLVTGLIAGRRGPVNKASGATMIAGAYASLWRLASVPGAGAIPAAAAVCDVTLLGAILGSNQASGDRVLAQATIALGNAGATLIIEDRLAHMGGLNGTVITAQTVGVDCNVGTSNMVARVGAADFSELAWYLEWYTATGATAVNATVAVTYNDASTGNIVVALPASVAASRRYPILPTNGNWIRSVQTVTLSATTATAGSFGVTATRPLAEVVTDVANKSVVLDYAALGAPKINTSACLGLSMLCITTSTGTVVGSLGFAEG